MLKVRPNPDYPPEEGRYLRGNDFSPVAVAIVLNCDEDKIPPELVKLVRVGIEAGAALSGSVQTPNIGFEKMVCNIVANPNIRYLILGGPESQAMPPERPSRPCSLTEWMKPTASWELQRLMRSCITCLWK